MDPIGVSVAAVALLLAVVFALARQLRDGTFRARGTTVTSDRLRQLADGQPTFVQFSGELCTQCRRNEEEFSRTLANRPGIGFRDVAAEDNLDLVRELGIMRSPTVVFVEPTGEVTARAHGALDRDAIVALIGSRA